MNINMSFAMKQNPHNVNPDGIDFTSTQINSSELFWRQLQIAEFDVSEMSLSSLMIALDSGDDRYIGLPIFTTGRAFQRMCQVHRESGIVNPPDLKGRKMGVPEFQQTAAVWARGILKDDFGVDQTDIEWFMDRLPEHSHGGVTGFTPPPGTTVNFIPPDKNIGSMILNREIDGTLLWYGPRKSKDKFNRSSVDLHNHFDVKYLFHLYSDAPPTINHTIVIRRTLAEKYPWAPMNIYKAMVTSKTVARYGLIENGKTIELVARYLNEQGLTSRRLELAEIFHSSILDK